MSYGRWGSEFGGRVGSAAVRGRTSSWGKLNSWFSGGRGVDAEADLRARWEGTPALPAAEHVQGLAAAAVVLTVPTPQLEERGRSG